MHSMQLLVLLWKNWILHRRYYFTTIFEILSPVLLTFVLFHSLLIDPPEEEEHSTHNIINYNSTVYKSFDPLDNTPNDLYLFYVPNTRSAKELMIMAFKLSSIRIDGYSSEKLLTSEKFAKVRNRTWGTVVLYNFNDSIFPPSLRYRINLNPWFRYNMDPPDETYYTGSINIRLEAKSPYRKGGFLAVQLMIDRAYITLRRQKRGLVMPKIEFRVKRIPIPKFTFTEVSDTYLFTEPIPFFICNGFLLFFVVVVKRVVDEKNSRAKEIMKMMGMSTTDYWGSVFFTNLLLATFICTILTIVYSIPMIGKNSILQKSSSSLFFIAILIYCASSLLLCFIISVMFTKTAISVTMTVMLWVSTTTVASSFVTMNEEIYIKMIYCLIPNLAMKLIFLVAYHHEVAGVGIGWDNIMQPPKMAQDDFSIGSIILMMLLSCILYTILLLYLDAVWPWQPGISKSPLFFLDESFWYPEHNIAITGFNDTASVKSKYFEEEPNDVIPTIVIHHMSKEYGTTNKKLAVDDLSLNIFHGQITVLLGPNGAGKTTTVNTLSGVFRPTSGTATINGCDIVKETNEARINLGICPEYTVLYDHLTVEEHLKLFAGLKGRRWWALAAEITYLLRWLQLLGKLRTPSKNLPVGMQRKLSLANAMIGNPEILVLDEPTIGLDPESRLCVWNLLEQLRPRCTILLTTNSMEEADTLGDRIAIVASGRLQCCGSSMFLKTIFGAGYYLCIEKDTNCQVDAITKLIHHHVPEAKLTYDIELELRYFLSYQAKRFIALFRELENSYQQLGIQSCGIDITTMDEIFMKVTQMSEEHYQINNKAKILEKNIDNTGSLFKQPSSKLSDGCTISETLQKMEALLFKRAQYAKRNTFLLMYQFVLPLIAVLLFIYLEDAMTIYSIERISDKFSFDVCSKFKEIKYGVFTIMGSGSNIQSLANYYEDTLLKHCVDPVKIPYTIDLEQFFLSRKYQGIRTYVKRYLVGANIGESGGNFSITSWYNGINYHLDPISLNLVTNALLRFLTKDDSAEIHVTARLYAKLKATSSGEEFKPSSSHKESFNIVFLPMGLTILSSSFVLFVVQERVSKVKLLQRMCGISGTIYWLMNFLWDFLIHIFSSLLMTIPFLVYCERRDIISLDAVGGIFLLLLLYGFSSIPLTYIASFIVTAPSSGFVFLTVLNMLFGISGIIVVTIMKGTVEISKVMWFLRLFPNFSASWGIRNIYIRSKYNLECTKYEKELLHEECKSIDHHCCTESVQIGIGYVELPYYSWDNLAAGKEYFALILMCFIWFGFTIFFETNFAENIGVFILNIKFIKDILKSYTEKQHIEDSDVLDESERIENLIINKTFQEEALLTFKLTKNFRSLCAVDNLTFAVHKEECFGLLGVNGAGKTTTFRMLTGDLVPSSGNVYIQQFSVQDSLRKFQMAIGYCPQHDALLDRLNAREMLQLFAHLRGIPRDNVENNVNTMISMCDLEEVKDKEISSLSGGTKRKLSLAMALIGAPPIILLDEPTSGVDPIARRKMWQTLTTMKSMLGLSYILTSHSMDECEILCNRIAIMVNGEFRCLGSMKNLKSKFGKGYTIIAKLKQPTTLLQKLKEFLLENVPLIQLKEDFHGTLYYHTTDTSLKWSKMFTIMETAKDNFGLQDYVVSGTRLEQIFLAFSRSQRPKL